MSDFASVVAEFRQAIDSASLIVIGTHLNPDGDALGSALALSHYLDSIGKPNEVLCHHPAPRNLLFLPGVDRVRQVPTKVGHDFAVMLDLDSIDRLGSPAAFITPVPNLAVIDHHVPHEAPGNIRIVDVESPATALILTRVLDRMDAEITPDIATCLLTGIVTDTGCFRYRNTTPSALSASAFLIEKGGNLELINEEVFQRKPLAGSRLLGHVLETMKFTCDDRIAWAKISVEDFESTQAEDTDTEGFVNELLFIESVQIAAIMRETKPERIRVSLRSRGNHDVAAVAREFGGGGHVNAAGCNFETSLEEAERALVERMTKCLDCS